MNYKNYKDGFARGMQQVRSSDVDVIKKCLLEVLKTSDHSKLWRYIKGITEPKASIAQDIEKVFMDYNIYDIWGLSTKKSIDN